MSVLTNFFSIKNIVVIGLYFVSLSSSAMNTPSLVPKEFYRKLSQSLKNLVTEDQLNQMIDELMKSSGLTTISSNTLCTLIDDPKGDCMCQLWALVPVLNDLDNSPVDKEFINLLALLSSCVEKDTSGKVEANIGGGLTGVARCDLGVLETFVKTQTIIPTTAKKRKELPKILFAAVRAALATRLYDMLSRCDLRVPSSCVWRAGLQQKPTLAMPFTESYLLFLKIIEEKDLPVVVNYLQYQANPQDSDETFVKANGKMLCPATLKKVSSCVPTRAPNEGELCLMIDMYSAFYGDEDDTNINDRFARCESELNQFDKFSDYVMQIAAAHTQFTDSQLAFDETLCPQPEPGYANARYLNDLARVKTTRIGIVNLAKREGKRTVAAIELRFDNACGEVRAINIPLNTLHVYAVPFDQIESKQKAWRNWIGKRGEG